MKTYFILILCAVALVTISNPGVIGAQSDNVEMQMSEVVKLRIHRSIESTEETASGLYVGKDRQNAYFITACHAVVQDDILVHSVQLQFRDSPQDFTAQVFEHYDPVLDLAVVKVPVADLPTELPEIVRKDPTLGAVVHIIGHPSAGGWSVAVGTIQNMNTSVGDIHHFTTSRDSSLAEGHSGGPVFDAQGGFLGMHISSGPTYGIEAKSLEIVNQLAAWHVPTNNISTVRVDPTAGGTEKQQAERDSINRSIDAYAESYNHKDANSLWKVWPNAPIKAKRAIEEYFRNARSITMKVTDRKIASSGSSATVMAQSSQEFVPKTGSVQKSPESPITFELEKRDNTWIITLVR